MDDYSMASLSESKNEWCARLVNVLTGPVIEGIRSIFKEANELCVESEEEEKYLMTFQTFLSRIPQWNESMIGEETKRIEDVSNCGYLEDLITCVHVIQLKALTCVRVGQKQKKVDIDIPSKSAFIHNVYKKVARQLYTSVYLFELDLPPLEIQKHNRELEHLVKECVLNTVRDTMPIDAILRAYMDETDEQVVEEPETEQRVPLPKPTPTPTPASSPAVTPVAASATPVVVSTPPVAVSTAPVAPPVTVSAPPIPVIEPLALTAGPETVSTKPVVETKPTAPTSAPVIDLKTSTPTPTQISFTDVDKAMDVKGQETTVNAPKNIEHLEKLSEARRQEEDDEEKVKIGENVSLDISDISDILEVL